MPAMGAARGAGASVHAAKPLAPAARTGRTGRGRRQCKRGHGLAEGGAVARPPTAAVAGAPSLASVASASSSSSTAVVQLSSA